MLDDNGFNQLCKGKHGYFLYNKHDIIVGKAMAYYGEWSEPEITLLNTFCNIGDTIIEAGSNIGLHTVPLAKMVGETGQVHAIEAQPVTFQMLCANVALNSLANVLCHNVAVGADEGYVHMPKFAYDQENNFGGSCAALGGGGLKTRKMPLDSLLELNDLHLIKADIEGMEYEMLLGAQGIISRFSPILYLENEPANESAPVLVEHLLGLDYDLFWHVPNLFNPDNYANNQDNIFGHYASFNLLCLPKDKVHLLDRDAFPLKSITSPEDKPF